MSEIGTSAESRIPNDEQTTEDSDVFRQVDNAKLGKFASFNDTTLQDIPTEILQCILVKAITMEVQNMKLAKTVWKEKADHVISRLGSVCSQWSSVLTTNFFRMELHKALDGIAHQKIRMEIVREVWLPHSFTLGIVALKDDIFLLCMRYENQDTSEISSAYNIRVYDRNNMAEVKDVIEIPGRYNGEITACNLSNCVYVLIHEIFGSLCASVLRITKDEDQKFNIQSWISDLGRSVDSISVSDAGRVILTSTPDDEIGPNVVSVYDPNGFLHHEVVLPQNVFGFKCIEGCVIRKSNGNLILASASKQSEIHVDLTEIDPNGIIQRQYTSALKPTNEIMFMSFVDAFGRLLIHDMNGGVEVLDSELNLLESTGPQYDDEVDVSFDGLHFNRDRNEVIGICAASVNRSILMFFHFLED